MKALKPVIQQDVTGYGIACVAAVAGATYAEVRSVAQRLSICVDDRRLWSDTRYIRALLRHYHLVASSRQPFRDWMALPDVALLALKWRIELDCAVWHWAVFVRQPAGPVVLDSKRGLRTNRRTDFGRMKPKWFLDIQRLKVKRKVIELIVGMT